MKNLIQKIYLFILPILVDLHNRTESYFVRYAIAKFAKVCAKNVGGNVSVFLSEADNVASVTLTASEVSAITMATGKKFQEIEADLDTIIREQEGEGIAKGSNLSITHRITMKFSKPSTLLNTLRQSLADASPCGILAITMDGNSQAWLTGYSVAEGTKRGLYLASDADGSGEGPADEEGNKITVVLESVSGYYDLPFDATQNAAITAETATYIDFN